MSLHMHRDRHTSRVEPRCPTCGGTKEDRGVMPKGGDEGTTRYYCTDTFHDTEEKK